MKPSARRVLLICCTLVFALMMACKPAFSNDRRPVVAGVDTAAYLRQAAASSKGAPYFFIADLRLASGAARFFVVDTKRRRIVAAGLCCSGRTDGAGHTLYSNDDGSHCSSKGIYQIAEHYTGSYGLAYRLDGLSPTNSHARARNVVLHSHECVPEADPAFAVQSYGCPTLNPAFLVRVDGWIKACGKTKPRLVIL